MNPRLVWFLALTACGNNGWVQAPDASNDSPVVDAAIDVEVTTSPIGWIRDLTPGALFAVAVSPTTHQVVTSGNALSSTGLLLSSFDSDGTTVWQVPRSAVGYDVVLDAEGSAYVAGTLLEGTNVQLAFCSKYDASGKLIWSYGPIANTQFVHLRLLSNGVIVALGASSGPANFGVGDMQPIGATDTVAVELDATGQYVTARRWGHAGSVTSMYLALAVDSADHVLLGGGFETAIDFGAKTFASQSTTTDDVLLIELNTSLDYVNHTQLSVTGAQLTSLAIDSNDDVLVSVSSGSAFTLGGVQVPKPSTLSEALVLAKLDGTLKTIWYNQYPSTYTVLTESLSVTPSDGLVATGVYAGSTDFGQGELPESAYQSLFAVRLDTTGATIDSFGLGQSNESNGYGIAWLDGDDFVIVGSCSGSTTFPGLLPVTCGDNHDGFIARIQMK